MFHKKNICKYYKFTYFKLPTFAYLNIHKQKTWQILLIWDTRKKFSKFKNIFSFFLSSSPSVHLHKTLLPWPTHSMTFFLKKISLPRNEKQIVYNIWKVFNFITAKRKMRISSDLQKKKSKQNMKVKWYRTTSTNSFHRVSPFFRKRAKGHNKNVIWNLF